MLNMTEEEYLSLISARGLIGARMGMVEPSEGLSDNPPTGTRRSASSIMTRWTPY